jgi:hypothetical protein
MTTKKTKKNDFFYVCNLCYFNTSKKTDYSRHCLTQKHKNNAFGVNDNAKNEKNEKYACGNCEKKYNDRAGLWRHSNKCFESNIKNNRDEITDKNLIMMLVKQNSELLEVIKNGTHNTNSNNTTNSNNKTFNLQIFLNETCKDAMNIMDFVDSIKLQLTDLENIGKVGYVKGISNIITTNLKALDITQRPVHCTDKKRETLYIKDENKWEKEDDTKIKIKKAIKRVATKNQRLILKFKELHPDCTKSVSPFSDQFNKIIVESMGGSGDNDCEKECKIINNISTVTLIDKNLV